MGWGEGGEGLSGKKDLKRCPLEILNKLGLLGDKKENYTIRSGEDLVSNACDKADNLLEPLQLSNRFLTLLLVLGVSLYVCDWVDL